MDQNQKKARSILRQLEKLATGRVNDAVKLAYLGEGGQAEIEGLDLRALREFKRSANGAVEIKLADQSALLERLYQLRKEAGDGMDSLLKALDGDDTKVPPGGV